MSGYEAPPDWYPDPGGQPQYRWWDGRQWTEHTGGPLPRASVAPPAARDPRLHQAENRLTPWARTAVVAYTAVGAVNGVTTWAMSNRLRPLGVWFREVVKNAGTPGYVAPPAPSLGGDGGLSDVAALVAVTSFVVFLVWQYRAATAARSLGYPARHSPGWGVGSWFVPVVNLWMPFQAIADCLPPGHRSRRGVWLLPVLLYAVAPLAGIGVLVAAMWPFDRAVGALFLVVLLGAEVALARKGLDLVTSVSRAHNEGDRPGRRP